MENYNIAQFQNDLNILDVTLTDSQINQFLTYYKMLVEWNRKMNLTAITEYDDVMKKHFIDSLSIVKAYNMIDILEVIDVGTGAGFPGLVLKIAFPNLKMTLLDSLNKRIQFLNAVIEKLKLSDVVAIHGRAEDYAKPNQLRQRYDLCVSRAVANLSTLSEYCLPFVKTGGRFISYKSEKIEQEKKRAVKAIELLGGKLENQIEFFLPDSDIYRNLVIIEKVTETPEKFPRRAGLPEKEPLE